MVRRDYGDWLQGHLYFIMAMRLPDKTYPQTAGYLYNPKGGLSSPTNMMLISRGYRNPAGYAFLRWSGYEPKSFRDLNVLIYDEETDAKSSRFDEHPPATWLWGREGNGYAQMRSKGWAPDSTVIQFKCGDYVWSHAFNCNQNSFYIYHKGRLALHSGLYDSYFGSEHCTYYYAATVSSNSVLVHQPGEFGSIWRRLPESDEDGYFPAYGGQRCQYSGGSTCFTFDEYLYRLNHKRFFERGSIRAFQVAPDHSYSYICGDATAAYNSPDYQYFKHSNPDKRNKPKLDLFTRSMIYLPGSNDLVIFDRINALDPSYRKAWLLHCVARPEVSGRLVKAEVPGHIEDFDGDTATITWIGGVLPPPDPADPGRLIVKTFLPAEHIIRRIGGEGYEFWVRGKNRVMSPGRKTIITPGAPGARVEAGSWRLEVSPTKPAKFDNFLHLIHIGDTSTKSLPPAEMVTAEDEKMVGLSVGRWLAMFGRKGEVDSAFTYRAPAGKIEHLVVDLQRGQRYRVSGIAGGEKTLTASAEGVLRFATEREGIVGLSPAR
jgi:hypothetical protein